MHDHVPSFMKGILATAAGAGLTLREILTSGSLLLTLVGAGVALAGGVWTYRTARVKHRTAETELRMKKLELRRMERESDNS